MTVRRSFHWGVWGVVGLLVLPVLLSAVARAVGPGIFSTPPQTLPSGGSFQLVYRGDVLQSVPAGYEPFQLGSSGVVLDSTYLSPNGTVSAAFTQPGNPEFYDGYQLQVGSNTYTVGDPMVALVTDIPASSFANSPTPLVVRSPSGAEEFSATPPAETLPPGRLPGGSLQPGGGLPRPPGRVTTYDPNALVPCQDEPCTLENLKVVVANIFNFLIRVGGAAAVLAVVIAGIRYIVAAFGGESGAIQAAKQSLRFAVAGTLLLLLSYVIVRTITKTILKNTDIFNQQ
jgi:uncharacterized membrane protein